MAAARCQGTLENASSEINLLVKAGRQFLTAEKKDNDIGCPSIGQEDIQVSLAVIFMVKKGNKKKELNTAYIPGGCELLWPFYD